MARKKRHEEHENHERWLVSYADFITLLFAFFVVMYAVSSVNEGKYRVLSESLVEAFKSASRTENVPLGNEARGGEGILEGGSSIVSGPWEGRPAGPVDRSEDAEQGDSMQFMMGEIERTLSTYMDDEMVNVTRGETWVEVELKSSLLFESGSARIARGAVSALKPIAAILKPLPNPIRVEGFTDNIPINTSAFPSNWELSAARAASVVHLLTQYGLDPRRLSATGFGEFRPIASNTTDSGRNKNRRVLLVILAEEEKRRVALPPGGGRS